jgi:hypothetical protein
MNNFKTLRETDLEKLGRLKIFSWLSAAEIKVLGSSLKMQNFQRNEVVLLESAANPSEAHVLVTGIARITCLNGRNERVERLRECHRKRSRIGVQKISSKRSEALVSLVFAQFRFA